ncbi:MAG TPA: formimidoylglutamase, partial [Cytophagaceae bacterium]
QEVCENLLQNNVLPLLIGGTHDIDIGQFLGYQSSNKFLNVLTVDAFIDMFGPENGGMHKHHTHKILAHDSHTVFHYAHLAYQTYLVDQDMLAVLEKLYFESYRLGQIREGMEEMEPVIRNADILSFDITSIKRNDAPGNANAQPFGLTGEEACQICWYAGLNQKLSSFGIYEYNPLYDVGGQTSGVIATMIWYFVEGFYMRKHSVDLSHPEFIKYNIALKHDPNKLVFYKNTRSEKWWMEVPYPDNKSMYARNSIVPCSYNDYLAASQGEVPGRWIMMHAKLI